jgi:cell migration-inducing and hyaluronan-binding protein
VTVHGTNNVRVENNVAYNNVGHCYFLEDGGGMG